MKVIDTQSLSLPNYFPIILGYFHLLYPRWKDHVMVCLPPISFQFLIQQHHVGGLKLPVVGEFTP